MMLTSPTWDAKNVHDVHDVPVVNFTILPKTGIKIDMFAEKIELSKKKTKTS